MTTSIHPVAEHNRELFEFLSMLEFNIQNDKDMLSKNIETSNTSRFREFLQDPEKAMLSVFHEVDNTVLEMLEKQLFNFIEKNTDVVGAKSNRLSTGRIDYYLLLKNDTNISIEPFMEFSHRLLDSSIGSKFKVNFYFPDGVVFEKIKGQVLKG